LRGDAKKNNKMNKIIDVQFPVLKDRGLDLNKVWYIEYYCFSETQNKLLRFKVIKGINQFPSISERKKYANKLIKEIKSDLASGWRPWNRTDVLYKDEIEYDLVSKKVGKLKKDGNQISKLMSEFIMTKEGGVSYKTFRGYKSNLRLFRDWLLKKNINNKVIEIDNKVMIRYWKYLILEKKLDKKTIHTYKVIIGSFFKFLLKRKIIFSDPMVDLPKALKTKDEAPIPFSRADLQILLTEIQRIDKQLYVACLIQYYAAVRPGNELRNLKISDIDLYNNRIHIKEQNAKTKGRTIDLSNNLVDVLIEYGYNKYDKDYYVMGKGGVPSPYKLSENVLRKRFNRIRDKLNMPNHYKFYSMKHTGAGDILATGLTIQELRDHLGHTSIETTDYYTKKHFGERNEKIINGFPKPF